MHVRGSALLSRALSLLLLLLFPFVFASETDFFIWPPAAGIDQNFAGDVEFTLGSVIDLAWKTDYPMLSVQLCQQNRNSSSSCFPLLSNHASITTFQWRVSLSTSGFLLTHSPVFYFELCSGSITSNIYFTSHYFNIREGRSQTTQSIVTATLNPAALAAASSSSLSSVTPIVVTTTLTPDITYNAAIQTQTTQTVSKSQTFTKSKTSQTQTSNPTGGTRGGLSEGAKVGLGVGVGGGVLCLGLGIFLGLCLRRRRPTQAQPEGLATAYKYVPEYGQDLDNPEIGEHSYMELPAEQQAQELSGGRSQMAQELPGSQMAQELPGSYGWKRP